MLWILDQLILRPERGIKTGISMHVTGVHPGGGGLRAPTPGFQTPN